MLIIEAIKQHERETGNIVPEWAKYATQDDSRRIQYWERKPANTELSYEFWGDTFTENATADFNFSYLCEDWRTPLQITDKMRDYVNPPETEYYLDNAAQKLNDLLSSYNVINYYYNPDSTACSDEDTPSLTHLAISAITHCSFDWSKTPYCSRWAAIHEQWISIVAKHNWKEVNLIKLRKLAKEKYKAMVNDPSRPQNNTLTSITENNTAPNTDTTNGLTSVDNPYRKPFTKRMGVYHSMDVYDVCTAFNLDPTTSHGVKKLLVSGGRNGGKSEIQDLKEAIWSIEERIKELGNN